MPRRDSFAAIVTDLARSLLYAERKRLGLPVGPAPFGFRTTGPRGHKRFVACKWSRDCAKLFIRMRQAGYSWAKIYLTCWKQNLLTADGREWSEGSIKRAVAGELKLQRLEAQLREAKLRKQAGEQT